MTTDQFEAFSAFRDRFRIECSRWLVAAGGRTGWLHDVIQRAVNEDGGPSYAIENPIVYNTALDSIDETDDIKVIIVGDNPGKNEQLDQNRRYLVGQAGKLGEGFFSKHPELGIDFRKNAIILNKTAIHTPKTKQLYRLITLGGDRARSLLSETQAWMASETAALSSTLGCDIWLVGYGELKPTGIFSEYARHLQSSLASTRASPGVFVYQHFSMNRFSIDLREHYDEALVLKANLAAIGLLHRKEVLGW
jgi:hypothetical protein